MWQQEKWSLVIWLEHREHSPHPFLTPIDYTRLYSQTLIPDLPGGVRVVVGRDPFFPESLAVPLGGVNVFVT